MSARAQDRGGRNARSARRGAPDSPAKFRAPGAAALRRALPPRLWACMERVVAAAEAQGAQVFLVGGPVRDLLLGRPLRDADLTVAPPPGRTRPAAREVAQAARRAGERVVAHQRFATVQFHGDWGALDLTTLRSERYAAPGALPITRLGTLAEDLQRRDFTVNALALPLGAAARAAQPRLVDSGGGLADLAARRLRIFHPRSFHDDPTRALRAARLAPRLGFRLHPASRAALRGALASGALAAVSGERIRAELVKLFAEPTLGLDPAAALGLLNRWRVLAALEPGLSLPAAAAGPLRRLGGLLAEGEAQRLAPGARNWLAGLMLWFAPLPLPLRQRALRRLAIRGQAAQRVIAYARLRGRVLRGLQRARGRGAADAVLGEVPAEELLALWAGAQPGLRRRIARYAREDRRAAPPLSGSDLLRLGLRGPEIGRALARLRAAHLDGALKSRAAALDFARGLARRAARRRL
ncbi:MAG: hypothetical protein OXU65_03980 [Deltaproteobacteria bacterium]|nr:hypothetical protein [Deltaproteobacteria bacterium]